MDTAAFQTDVQHIQGMSAAVVAHIAREAERLSPTQRDSLLKLLKKGDAKHRTLLGRAIAKLDHILHRFLLRHHANS